MDPILQKFRDKFFEEANTLLDQMEKDVLELEKNPNSKELIESAFRAMHTIKGVSGMYGFDFICEFTHCMESIYQSIRDSKLEFNKEIFEITFCSLDHIRKLLNDEKLADPSNQVKHNQLINDINTILITCYDKQEQPQKNKTDQNKSEINNELNTWHILIMADEKIYFRGINLLSIFRDLSQLGNYEISRVSSISDDTHDAWSIILVSNATVDDLSSIFLFIEDNVKITRISGLDLLNNNLAITEEKGQSIIEYIEQAGNSNSNSSLNGEAMDIKASSVIKNNNHIKRISVDSEKLDNLMYLVSELITVNSQLNLHSSGAAFESIRPYVEKVDNLSKQFRNTALNIRLVPLSDLLLRFQRLIRDLSKHLNKKVELKTQGVETELDKNTIDQLSDPLMHIIRNSIDHGIELPEVRKQKGKSETGTIKITAYNSGNYVYIKIEDDGSGVSFDKIRQKAISKGILKSSDKPSEKDLLNLIFLPGFSTAQNLTEVSGRGVGMDVVKKKILDLRGDVIVDTQEGNGTCFTLKLQQSVTIIDTLLFVVEDSNFIVPISEIKICSQFEISEIEKRRNTGTIPFNDQLIPFVDLRQKLNIIGKYDKKVKVIILTNNGKYLALLSDKIIGEHQAVLKPLGKSFQKQNYLTSASQLGDGNLALMIDTNNIFQAIEVVG